MCACEKVPPEIRHLRDCDDPDCPRSQITPAQRERNARPTKPLELRYLERNDGRFTGGGIEACGLVIFDLERYHCPIDLEGDARDPLTLERKAARPCGGPLAINRTDRVVVCLMCSARFVVCDGCANALALPPDLFAIVGAQMRGDRLPEAREAIDAIARGAGEPTTLDAPGEAEAVARGERDDRAKASPEVIMFAKFAEIVGRLGGFDPAEIVGRLGGFGERFATEAERRPIEDRLRTQTRRDAAALADAIVAWRREPPKTREALIAMLRALDIPGAARLLEAAEQLANRAGVVHR